jgi:hypothetical protein
MILFHFGLDTILIIDRKDTTRKTKAWMGGWDHKGYLRDWLGDVEWILLAKDRDR